MRNKLLCWAILVVGCTSLVLVQADELPAGALCYKGPSWPGIDKIPGEYNGCTACTSDIKHSNGSCGALAAMGQNGSLCGLVDISDTWIHREKKPSPQVCVYCDQSSPIAYTYKKPVTGGACIGGGID